LLHREVGAALEALYGDQKEEIVPRLAFHYAAAGDEERERCYSRLAGEGAAERYAHAEALRYLTRALELTPETEGYLTERWELLLTREKVNNWRGDRAAQADDLDALERLAEMMDDDQRGSRQVEVALRRAELAHLCSDSAGSAALAETAVRLAQQAGDTIHQARGFFLWGLALEEQEKLQDSQGKYELGLALAQAAGDRGLQCDGLRGLGFACRYDWTLTKREAYLQQALSIARELGDRPKEAAALFHLGIVAHLRLERFVAEDYFRQVLTVSQEAGFRRFEGRIEEWSGYLNLQYDDFARAQGQLERALQVSREVADWFSVLRCLFHLAIRHRRTGDFERSRHYALTALRLSRKMNQKDAIAAASYHIGISHYYQAGYSAGEPYLQQAVRLGREWEAQDYKAWGLTGVGLNAMAQGNYGAARDALAGSRRLYRQVPEQNVFARDDDAFAQSALALLHHQLGEDDPAREYAQRALEIHRSTWGPHRPALALTRLGHALVGLGNLEEGRMAYQEALDLRRELGQAYLATEPLVGLARVALAQRDLLQAGAYVDEISSHLERGGPAPGRGHPLDGTDEPLRIYLTCYRVLRANNDPRAPHVLEDGYNLLQERAARIDDENLRRSYLENVAAHREILREWQSAEAST
jgi:tetratricopeptide (TPR) repeat protein